VISEPVVLDTDVASLSLKGKLPTDVLRQLAGRVPLLTFVTLAELTRWVEQRQWGAHRRELLARWLVGKHVLHSDDDVATHGGPSPPTPISEADPGRQTTHG
jgi:hypothetical protein